MEATLKDGSIVVVDEDDAHFFALGTWRYALSFRGKKYVEWTTTRQGRRVRATLHRLIMGAGPGQIVDHIDGDTLNNRRSNLRFVNGAQNARNSIKTNRPSLSRFKGVTRAKYGWSARIWDGHKNIHLGKTKNEVEAAYRYDLASLEIHGEYGRTNFLPLVR